MNGADYNQLEAKMAKQIGAQVIKNSGRGMNKGDMKTDSLLIDAKFTEKDSYSLNYKAFRKHELDAMRINKAGVVVAVFTAHKDRRIAMVDFDYLLELEELKAMYEGLE